MPTVMEAGGFEPPSRDISGQASTCIVVYLILARPSAERQALELASPRLISPSRHERPAKAIPLFDALEEPAGNSPSGRAALIRRPFATVCCQLKLVCRVFYQANRHPGHATWPSTCPVEAIRPLFTLKRPIPPYLYYTIIRPK